MSELAKLLSDLDQLSAKFVARIVLGRLRLGFSDKTILDALSVAERGDKSARKKLMKPIKSGRTPGIWRRQCCRRDWTRPWSD